MANKLRRIAAQRVIPAVPAVPAVPAYCELTPVYSDFGAYAGALKLQVKLTEAMYRRPIGSVYFNGRGLAQTVTIPPSLSALFGVSGEAQVWYYEKKCYPARPAVPGAPARAVYERLTGWDGGAVSLGSFVGDGYLQFSLGANNAGAIVGLATGPDHGGPSDTSHAFYATAGNLYVYEGGNVVMAVPGGVAGNPALRIERRGAQVSYWTQDALLHVSAKPSSGRARIDASLYAVGDYVDDPSIGALVKARASGGIGISAGLSVRPRATGRIGITTSARGRAGSTVYGRAAGNVGISPSAQGSATINASALTNVGITGLARPASNVSRGVAPAFTGAASDSAYAFAMATYQGRPRGEAIGGFPVVEAAIAVGNMPAPLGVAICLSGSLLESAGRGPAAVGVGADRPYAASAGRYGGRYFGIGYESTTSPDSARIEEALILLGEFELAAEVAATFRSSVTVGGSWAIEIEIEQGFHWLDAIMVSSSVSELSDRLMDFGAALYITDAVIPGSSKSVQMATNAQSWAPTHYSNFDFHAITKSADQTFMLCSDGIYTLEHSGESMQIAADLGGRDFGTNQGKRIEAVYIAGVADGQLDVVVQVDGGNQYRYPADGGDAMLRAKIGRGLKGRTWRIRLEGDDVQGADIASIEPGVAVSRRRL